MRKNQSGNTIVATLVALTILSFFVGIAVDYTGNVSRNTQRSRAFEDAVEIGDGCINLAFSTWREICRKSGAPTNPPTTYFDGSTTPTPTPTSANFPSFPSATISNFKVQAVDQLLTLNSTIPPVSALPAASPPPKVTGPGTGTYSYFYLASADVTVPALVGNLTARVRRVFEKRYTSPWNWAVLYNDPMEISPSPSAALTLNGWVHTNDNLYTGSNKLTLTDRLTSVGSWTTGWAPGDTSHNGILPTSPSYPANLPPGREQFYAPFDWNPATFNTTDSNPNNDGYHELIERPDNSYADPLASARMYNQAGVKILVNGLNLVTVYNQAGTLLTPLSSGNDKVLYDAATAAIKTNDSITDNREAATVRLVTFDMNQFKTKLPTSISSGWNGIVYIADTSATSSAHRGVRIKNGTLLPTGGITIASENPVYIMGDYNTGGTTPPSNASTPDPTQPTVSGYTAQPSSIISDAITVLSRNWQDNNSNQNLSNRRAVNTTINAALLSGIVPTNNGGNGRYSGGVENFTRFLEDWSGKSFTYYGSMIELFPSKQGVGAWGNGAVYVDPANRFWYYDSALSSDTSGDVPGYVSTTAYLQQQRWYLQY